MKIPRAESRFITYDEVYEKDPYDLTIVSEAKFEFDQELNKEVLRVKVQPDKGEPKDWTINATCQNKLRDAFGEDSKGWIGKHIILTPGKTQRGARMIDIFIEGKGKEKKGEALPIEKEVS